MIQSMCFRIEVFSHITFHPCSAAPHLAGTSISTKSVQLNWGTCTAAGCMTQRDSGKAIMADWSKSVSEDNGVNVRLCFSHYDKDGNGCIDTLDLESVLKVGSTKMFHVALSFL